MRWNLRQKKCTVWLAILLILSLGTIKAQTRDTLGFYKKIKKFAYRKKVTTMLYHAVFVDLAPENYDKKPLSDEQKKEDPNQRYKGKIIRSITIQTYDPFGYSVNDTTRTKINAFQKLANGYHVKTRTRIIKNLLLFKKHEAFDPLKFSESERLLRTTNYINDARIYVEQTGKKSDSVDIKVFVKDRWAMDAPFALTATSGHITLIDKNILGNGQGFEQYFGYAPTTGYEARGIYRITNIHNTYISSNYFYTSTPAITVAGFSFNRPFYSPLAKWAGGIDASRAWSSYTGKEVNATEEKKYRLDYYLRDIWAARSFALHAKQAHNKRLSNFILALRNAGTIFENKPPANVDIRQVYQNSSLFLGSAGISINKYYKDQFIFRFGANEDIPEGLILQGLFGMQYKENPKLRYYSGFEISGGKHFKKLGYFSSTIAMGSFFNKGLTTNTTLNSGISYFSDLRPVKRWYFRQFAYLKFTSGFGKDSAEKISLRTEELYGLNCDYLKGDVKMVLNLETVAYSPYNILGFRFAPIVLVGFGSVCENTQQLLKTKICQGYSIGLLVRNENLLNGSFQFTIGIYPDQTQLKNIFRMNPVTSISLKVRSFAISKPATTAFE